MFNLQEEPTSVIREIKALDNRGVHNFSYHTLECYFKINKLVASRKIRKLNPRIVEIQGIGPAGHKIFVYSFNSEDKQLLIDKQQQATIYSIDPLPLEKESGFIEIQYNLDDVFDPKSYSSAKKRHQRIKYPFTWLAKNGFTSQIIRKDSAFVQKIHELHEIWRENKENDPKTYKIMFPSKRYIFCVEHALQFPNDYICFVILKEAVVYAVRVVGISGKHVYDLAFFGNQWDAPSQLMNYVDILILDELHKKGFMYFNCGAALNTQLKQFKTHLPHNNVISYKYSKGTK